MSGKKLFISHAHADRELVNAFVDLLDTGCQIPRGEIFCTSLPDLGIDPGQPFVNFIRDNIETATLVVLMLSPHYFNSQFCLGELGATWVLGVSVFPIVIPDMEIGKIGNLLTGVQMGMITDKFHLDRLRDLLIGSHGIRDFKTGTWTFKRDEFLGKLSALLARIDKPKTVSLQEFHELESKYETCYQLYLEGQKESERKNIIIEKLKKAKNAEDADSIVLEGLPETERINQLCAQAQRSMRDLSSRYMKQALYLDYLGDEMIPEMDDYLPDIDRLVHDGYLKQNFDTGGVYPNSREQTVADAQKAIQSLASFLRSGEVSDEHFEAFHRREGYDLDLAIRRFWEDYLWNPFPPFPPDS